MFVVSERILEKGKTSSVPRGRARASTTKSAAGSGFEFVVRRGAAARRAPYAIARFGHSDGTRAPAEKRLFRGHARPRRRRLVCAAGPGGRRSRRRREKRVPARETDEKSRRPPRTSNVASCAVSSPPPMSVRTPRRSSRSSPPSPYTPSDVLVDDVTRNAPRVRREKVGGRRRSAVDGKRDRRAECEGRGRAEIK